MDLEKRKKESETHQTRIIFPNALNDHGTLFGGDVLKWMDEVAYITAIRFCRQEMVTVSADRINFLQPLPEGNIVELVGRVTQVGNASITVSVSIYSESFKDDTMLKVVEGNFRFAAIDDQHRLIRIAPPQ